MSFLNIEKYKDTKDKQYNYQKQKQFNQFRYIIYLTVSFISRTAAK
ncbi:hypothetical protein GCM10009865_05800 [Aeromicrobium ponti]